jgi:hypothetical protein
MTTAQPDERTSTPDKNPILKRRGLLAAGAALVAGLVGKLTETPVSAGSDGDVILGGNSGANKTTAETSILNNASENVGGPAFHGFRSPGAVVAVPTTLNAGLIGDTFATNAPGVFGRAQSGSQAKGVHGVSFPGAGTYGESTIGTGAYGRSTSGIPMFGQVAAGSSAITVGIYGENTSSSKSGYGIYGFCSNGHAVVGTTAGAAGTSGIVGTTIGAPGTYAGAFYGPVAVVGDFAVFNGAKSAAVPHPDGSHRRVYCLESPESWFEDFGHGRLDCGRAEVTIDPDFAAIVDLTDYHVFVTGYDTDAFLRVRRRTGTGFAVEADERLAAITGRGDADLNAAFSWRIVAKRKDIPGARLQAVAVPPELGRPPLPDVSSYNTEV